MTQLAANSREPSWARWLPPQIQSISRRTLDRTELDPMNFR